MAGYATRLAGDDDLREFLGNSGLGNHPALFRLMRNVGKTLAENTMDGTQNANQPNQDADPTYKLFDHPSSRQR